MAVTHSNDEAAEYRSAHARYAAFAAARRGYEFRSLDGRDGYLFEVSDGARSALFTTGAGSPYAMNSASAASLAKDKAFSAAALTRAGLPAAPGPLFFITDRYAPMRAPGREASDARAYARTADYPLFCKPVNGSNGRFAEVIADPEAFDDYIERASRDHFAMLVQPFLRGAEHRVFVLDGEALFAYRKHPPRVVGDGVSTLRALLAPLLKEHTMPAQRARVRDAAGALVGLDAIADAGAVLTLEGPANLSAGGAADAPGAAPAPFAALALAAADAIGLRLAGVDLFEQEDGSLVIIEVNSNPMIKTLELYERWDLIERIWCANFDAALR